MHECIYFDNAATSWPKPDAMIKAMIDFNAGVGANPGRSGHRLSVDASRIIFSAREMITRLLGAHDPHRIIFTRNATEGLNTILRGLLRPGEHVVTSSMEHNSVMRPLRELERQGVELTVVKCSSDGNIAPGDMAAAIKGNTRLIVIAHASNVTGTIAPVADIAHIAHDHGLLLCVDAAQTAGSVPIDVLADDIDTLVFTGHKSLYGPQGTGGFYVRNGLESKICPLEYGGTGSRSEFETQPEFMPDRFESGTPNTIGIAGLGAGAAAVAAIGVQAIREREKAITKIFMDGLTSIKGARIYGDKDPDRRTAVVSFAIDGISSSDLAHNLDERFNIMSRPGLHCAPAAHRTLGTFPDGAVRFSFGIFTTEEEITIAMKAIETLSCERL